MNNYNYHSIYQENKKGIEIMYEEWKLTKQIKDKLDIKNLYNYGIFEEKDIKKVNDIINQTNDEIREILSFISESQETQKAIDYLNDIDL